VTALLRILGVELMAHLGRTLPAPVARILSALMLVGANLLPVWAVVEGRLGMGDVLLVYWFENVVIWFATTMRILTARRPSRRPFLRGPAGRPGDFGRLEETLSAKTWVTGDPALALFFALHFGIFTVVHGIFAAVLAGMSGLRGSLLDWVAAAAAILLSHMLSLGLHWLGRGERRAVSPGWAMAAPYPRMLALHVTVVVGFFLLGGPDGRTAHEVATVVLLMGLKTALDLCFHLGEHLVYARRTRVPARPDDGALA
jgi:hypothetical protein